MRTFEKKATKLDFRCSLCHWLLFSSKTIFWTSIYIFKGLSAAILGWMCSFLSVPIATKFLLYYVKFSVPLIMGQETLIKHMACSLFQYSSNSLDLEHWR